MPLRDRATAGRNHRAWPAGLVLLLLASAPLSAGTVEPVLRFGKLGREQGLSNNWVLAVQRDQRGFLWVGTQEGLNRYDGQSVVVYRHVPTDQHSLPSPVAGVLFEDSRGRLWVGSRWASEGLALYDRDHDNFIRFPHGPGSGGLSDDRVNAIAEASDGRLWIGTRRGLHRGDPQRGRFEDFGFASLPEGQAPPRQVVSLLRARSGQLWVGTTEGLFVFDEERRSCVPWQAFDGRPPEGLARVRVEALAEDALGTIWAGTIGQGLFEINPATRRLVHHRARPDDPDGLSHSHVRCLGADGQGRLWVGTENGGLNVLERGSRRFRRFLPDPLEPAALGSASLYTLVSDSQGILWIGTYNDGLNYLAPAEQRFQHIRPSRDGLRDAHVSALLEDHAGHLWIGTDQGGLHRVDARTGRYSYFTHDPSETRSIGSNSVLTLLEDERGVLWLGGWDGGLTRLDPATGRSERFRHRVDDPRSIVGNDVWKVRRLRTGELLVATQQGTDLFDRRTGHFSRLSARYADVRDSMTLTALEDSLGNLWIGQSGRVQHIDRATGRVTTYAHRPDGPSPLGSGMVFDLVEDGAGNVWIGGESGLRCLLAPRPPGSALATVAGLPQEAVTNVIEDSSGNIWATTQRGLVRLGGAVHNPRHPQLVAFDVHDGLQASEFARGASLRGRDGRLYLGGPRGLNVFRPEEITLNATPPPVVLTGLRIFNRPVWPGAPDSPLSRAVTETRELTLAQDRYVVTFEFAALNLALPQKNRYAYRLEGLEDGWNEVGARHEATYTQLRHGQYVLRVRAANNDGVWNDEGLALRVSVPPRWHEREAVRIVLVTLVGLLLLGTYRQRVRQLRARERELTRRVEERTHALNELNAELEQRVAARTAELEEEKERLAVTLRSIGDAVIATDIESRVVLMNRIAEQLTGRVAADVRGRPLSEVLPLLDASTRGPGPDPVAAALSGQSAWALPLQGLLVRRDGVELVVAQSAAPIYDHYSRPVGVVLVFRDVTEQRRVEAQLQSSQKLDALGILAGGIAHDFNNLLTGIFGHIEVLRRRRGDRPEDVPTLEKAVALIERARGLTGQLLTFSRGGEPVTAPLALGELLRKSVEFALSGSNVVCKLEIPPDLWACVADRRQIDQVIDNLVLNARQALPAGGTITVTAENVEVDDDWRLPLEAGRYVRISVRDQGAGIAPEIRARIFEPFFTTKPKGSGLGLATSHSIVRRHGGYIDVESEPGEGTTFQVYLPAADGAAPAASQALPQAATRACRVLVMDDEGYLREVAQELLTELGHTVETVAEGDGAVAAYERAQAAALPFDLVLLDLTIPGGEGGRAVLDRLRVIDPHVRAVASSGYSGDPIMADPRGHGFAAQLPKPYTIDDLAEAIGRALEPDDRS